MREFRDLTGLDEGLAVRLPVVITVLVAAVVVTALFLFLQRSRTGKAMRAYSDNEDLALLSGINPDRVVAVTWIIAASLATIAGVLYGLDKSFPALRLLPASPADLRGGHRGRHRPADRCGGGRLHRRLLRGDADLCLPALRGIFRLRAGRAASAAVDGVQIRHLLRHPGAGAADPTYRHIQGEGAMSERMRIVVLYGIMAALLVIVGVFQSWNLSITIINLCLISAIMALGVNIQWGYAGIFNVGIMGFAALGGLAAVIVSMRLSWAPGRSVWRGASAWRS